ESIVVKTLAALEVIMNVEQFVDLLEIPHRKRNALVPNRRVLFVAGLKLYQLLAARFAHREVRRRSCVRLFVNPNDLGQRLARERVTIKQIFPTPDHHSELRAPIADMIIANNVMAEKARDPRQ